MQLLASFNPELPYAITDNMWYRSFILFLGFVFFIDHSCSHPVTSTLSSKFGVPAV